MSSAAPDDHYAARILEMLESDRRRLREDPGHAHVVLWMAEEVRDAAGRLKLPREQSRSMSLAAAQARQAALETRRRERESSRQSGKVRAA
jgi:hypothetical protein